MSGYRVSVISGPRSNGLSGSPKRCFLGGHLLLHGLPGLLGQLDLEQVAGRHRVVAADHHHPGEGLLERPGRRGVRGGRPGDHAAQEPARPVHAEEPDRLQPALAERRVPGHPGVQFGAERPAGFLAAPAGLGHRGGDLLPHVVPQPTALGRGERLQLQ